MNTLILVFDREAPQAAEVAAALVDELADDDAYGKVSVSDGDARAYLYPLLDSEEEVFQDWPPELIPEHPGLLALDYRKADLAKRLVVRLAEVFDFVVDTDFGERLTSSDFAERTRLDPAWTWYHQPGWAASADGWAPH